MIASQAGIQGAAAPWRGVGRPHIFPLFQGWGGEEDFLNRPAQQAINVDEILTFCYTRIVTLKHVLTLLKPYLYVFLLMQNCEVDI
jgi:hypothetical protein